MNRNNLVLNNYRESNLEDSDVFLHVFPSKTNLKLRNVSIVINVITNLDSSKASCPDFNRALALKNCELELSCILAELFNVCLKVSQIVGRSLR